MTRSIVAERECIGGRYHLAGTQIPIAMIRADYAADEDVLTLYEKFELTAEEVEAALLFPFPEQCEPNVVENETSWVLKCSCGEETWSHGALQHDQEVSCICGRCWRVVFRVDLIGV